MKPLHNRYRVKIGNFVLGWIVQTDVTVRYLSHLEPLGNYATSILSAMDHFVANVPVEMSPHLKLEPMSESEMR